MTVDALARLSQATLMLAEARTLDDVRAIRDMAAAAREYARAAGLGDEAIGHASAIKLDAERKAGAILADMDRSKVGDAGGSVSGRPLLTKPTLADLGVSRTQSSRWQGLARLPEEEYSGLRDRVQARMRAASASVIAEQDRTIAATTPAALPVGVFDVLLADPPWQYDFAETDNRAIENQYPTMDAVDIAAYHDKDGRSIQSVVADDAVLFLWATSPKLREALLVMDGWGFDYVTQAVWVKDRIGMGYWFRQQHETLLVGRRGNVSPPAREFRHSSVIDARREGHSAKPQAAYALIEDMFPDATRLEVFARDARDGWTTFGNQL